MNTATMIAPQDAIALGLTARVKVFAPCDCAACAAGRRWFYCERPELVASYQCAPRFVDCPDVPNEKDVREIGAEHPGCSLVYIDPPWGQS